MYNANQFNYPMQQPANYPSSVPSQQTVAHQTLEQAFAPIPQANYSVPDPNSNQAYQQFQPASSQFNMPSMPQIQTFEAYPQVQTQINLQGMPPLTVNTPRIDPTKYS